MKGNRGRFKKGEKKPGQGKRGPGKLTKTVKEAFEAAFADLQSHEQANLLAWAEKNPTDFYRIAAKLIPAVVDATVNGSLEFTAIERRIVRPKS